jgi:hypothetical protein
MGNVFGKYSEWEVEEDHENNHAGERVEEMVLDGAVEQVAGPVDPNHVLEEPPAQPVAVEEAPLERTPKSRGRGSRTGSNLQRGASAEKVEQPAPVVEPEQPAEEMAVEETPKGRRPRTNSGLGRKQSSNIAVEAEASPKPKRGGSKASEG